MTRLRKQSAMQLVLFFLVAGWASAQNTNTNTNTNQQTTNAPATTSTNTNNQNTTPTTSTNRATTTNTQPTGQTTGITGIPSVTTSSKSSSTSAGNAGNGDGPNDLPTIAGYGIPTQGVPWTGGASFMYKSNLPEGTIFIAVGALLGAMGAAVLAWRALVAWSLHRSVKRANEKMLAPVDGKLSKGGYRTTTIPLASSNHSLDHLSPGHRKSIGRQTLGGTTNTAARNSSLFFSPTAGAGNHSSMYSNANRSSGYLPSGYYAAPGAAPPGSSHVGSGNSRSAFARNSMYNVSPPSSPGLPPSRSGASVHSTVYHQPSLTSLNLHVPGNAQPGGRAPSANLDELFGNDPAGRR